MPYAVCFSGCAIAFFGEIYIIKLWGVSIRRLKPTQSIVSETNSLPIGLNRNCWKHAEYHGCSKYYASHPTDWVKSELLETIYPRCLLGGLVVPPYRLG